MAFNLKNYESVKERKKRFYEAFKDGRLVVECVRLNEQEAVFKCTVYKSSEDQEKALPFSTGYAQEFKGQGSMANKTSWCENCEESSVGRALDNAGFSNFNGPSKEEMIKVQRGSPDHEQQPQQQVGDTSSVVSSGDYVLQFGGNKGKALRTFSRGELEEMGLKISEYLTRTKTAPKMYIETQEKIENYLNSL